MKKSTTGPTWVATFLKVLTFFVSCIYWQQASHACSVHDHGCIFHAFGSTVSTSTAVTTGPSTLHIYAIGTTPTTGTPSTVDFDNKVLLPGLTSNLFDRVYYQPTGPYIVNSTSYGAANPPPDWNPGGNDGARQVYPSQYKVTFNANTAQARHTGDLNGGENGLIPGATGCPNMPGAANCEAVVVTGNVPSGIYEQRVRIFNYYGVPNPQVDIQAGAYVTGSGVLISGTHIPTQGGKEIAYFTTLTGTGAISDTYKYEFYDRGFDPHAAGVAWFDRNRSHMKTTAVTTGDHRVTSTYRNTLTTRTTIQGDGQFDQHSWTTSKLVGRTVEEIVRPKAAVFCTDGRLSVACNTPGAVDFNSYEARSLEAVWANKFEQERISQLPPKEWPADVERKKREAVWQEFSNEIVKKDNDGKYVQSGFMKVFLGFGVVANALATKADTYKDAADDGAHPYWDGRNPDNFSTTENLRFGVSQILPGMAKGGVNLGWQLGNGLNVSKNIAFGSSEEFQSSIAYFNANPNIWEYSNGTQSSIGFATQIGVPATIAKIRTPVSAGSVNGVISTTSSRFNAILPEPRPSVLTPVKQLGLTSQAVRLKEVEDLFSSTNARRGVTIENQTFLPRDGQNVPVFEGVSTMQVKRYFIDLAGSEVLPPPIKITGRVGGEILYLLKTDRGNFVLRDFASSTSTSGPVWTIEVPKSAMLNVPNTSGAFEIKFTK